MKISANSTSDKVKKQVESYGSIPVVKGLADRGEDSKRPKVDTRFCSFFPTCPSDEYDSVPSQKYSRPLLDVFACGQVSSPRLYLLTP